MREMVVCQGQQALSIPKVTVLSRQILESFYEQWIFICQSWPVSDQRSISNVLYWVDWYNLFLFLILASKAASDSALPYPDSLRGRDDTYWYLSYATQALMLLIFSHWILTICKVCPIYGWGNWSSEKSSSLPKVALGAKWGTKIQTKQGLSVSKSPCSFHYTMVTSWKRSTLYFHSPFATLWHLT